MYIKIEMIFISLFLTLLLQFASCALPTTRAENQRNFVNICYTPKPLQGFDLGQFLGFQPEGGYYSVISNDIIRRHFAEILHGKQLTVQDNFRNSLCYRANLKLGAQGLQFNATGFGSLSGTWNCGPSKNHLGVFQCDSITSGSSKFHDNFNIYPVYTDNKNFKLAALCYPNGDAGWVVLAATPTLTGEEMKVIAEKVNGLGFQYQDFVTTYGDSCPK